MLDNCALYSDSRKSDRRFVEPGNCESVSSETVYQGSIAERRSDGSFDYPSATRFVVWAIFLDTRVVFMCGISR